MNVNDPSLPNPFLILLVFSLTLAVVRVFTTLVHEMGHALAGVMLLKGDFDIYIGSYGDPEKGYHFKLWRFKFHLTYEPFSIQKGVFRSEQQETTYLKDFLVTLGGPIASLFTAGIYIYLAVFSSMPEIIQMAFYILTGSSFLDFWYNIKPSTEPIELHNGTIVYNDGYILKYRWSQMFGKNAQRDETEIDQVVNEEN